MLGASANLSKPAPWPERARMQHQVGNAAVRFGLPHLRAMAGDPAPRPGGGHSAM